MSSAHTAPPAGRDRSRRLTFAVWHNPLARPVDRLEAIAVILVVTVWVLAFPVIAVAGSLVWADISASIVQDQHDRTATSALLLADAVVDVSPAQEVAVIEQQSVPAKWVAPDGSERTGTVTAAAGQKAGERHRIWVDRAGVAVEPPMDVSTAAMLVILAVLGALAIIGSALRVSLAALRWRLNRRRAAEWDRAWTLIEPGWSGR